MNNQSTNYSRLLRLPEVKHLTGMSRSSIYKYMKRGEFPTSFQITQRCISWDEAEIMSWIKERIEKNQQKCS